MNVSSAWSSVNNRLDSHFFSMAGQHLFARLSGDYNPMHVDPVQARRTLFGHAVVHGVHGLMWALDCLLRKRDSSFVSIRTLRAQFRKQIPADTEAAFSVLEENGDEFSLSITVDGEAATLVQGSWGQAPRSAARPGIMRTVGLCEEWNIDDAATTRGVLPLEMDTELLNRLFPALARFIPSIQAAEIAAATRLVGMVCPGLRSLFMNLDLKAVTGDGEAMGLAYGIKRANPRVGTVDLEVAGPTLQGVLATLVRPRPQPQPSMGEVRKALAGACFSGQRALVVGGSRGIGEVTAKCIAAGGGSVVITYVRGEEDARRVVDEIIEAGGRAYSILLDCLQPIAGIDEHLAGLGVPTHLYYFATPSIPVNAKRIFSAAAFRRMAQYYVDGFAGLVQAVYPLSAGNLTILYPSTVFLNQAEPGTGEYCAAKAAGEAVCAHLRKVLPGTLFVMPRLPRMRTDQTASILPVKSLEPLAVMADILRRMADDSKPDGQELPAAAG